MTTHRLDPLPHAGTISVFLVLVLTAVTGRCPPRHLRRSQLSWLPPRHWAFPMGGALLVVSSVLPPGMLGPADPGRLTTDMPVDPFVLLLLPPLLSDGRRLVVEAGDVPPVPGPSEGRTVFTSRAAGCTVCHPGEPDHHGVGPSLAAVATRALNRVAGLDAAGYLRPSILLPDQYVVDGYPSDQMLPIHLYRLSVEEVDALVAYLLTLEEP